MPASKSEQILDVAEHMVRSGGFHNFSFRDVAEVVGTKSASVHYHFPTKEDLGTALACRYRQRFMATLGEPRQEGASKADRLAHYIEMFRRSLRQDGLMCLCGMLGAEVKALPDPVAKQAKTFFEENLQWLSTLLSPRDRSPKGTETEAAVILSMLEGAMILSRTLERDEMFELVAANIISTYMDEL